MAEQEVVKKGAGTKTSVKSYQRGIEAEKQKMKNYSKGFETNVKAFQAEIQAQKKNMANAVKFFISEVDKKKRDFKSYAHGTFKDYIKAFWG